jgi:hypothetical protein
VTEQEHLDSMLLFLWRHGQKIDSINLQGDEANNDAVKLRQLPQLVQLSSLCLKLMKLQLHPMKGSLGVLAGAPPLKQLRLTNCELIDDEQGLAAALMQLPQLEHLSLVDTSCGHASSSASRWAKQLMRSRAPGGPTLARALQHLQQLTYLELVSIDMQAPDGEDQPRLQHLQQLKKLADLRITAYAEDEQDVITASMLSGASHLTHLQLSACEIEPGALARKAQLQHLQLHLQRRRIVGGTAGVAELLLHLKQMQQLTYLDLKDSLSYDWLLDNEGNPIVLEQDPPGVADPPAAAFTALTASSKLQHLNISKCTLPLGVWPHIFPADRQLPHLRFMDVGYIQHCPNAPETWDGDWQAPLNGKHIVSCCPNLQSLNLMGMPCKEELLWPLQRLSGLRTMLLYTAHHDWEGLEMVCHLTGLQDLTLQARHSTRVGLLQLSQLKQLTHLDFIGKDSSAKIMQVQATH